MEKKIILVPLFFLLLISLIPQVRGAETNNPPYVSMKFKANSRDEIQLNVEIHHFVMPFAFDESKFVIGFYSPTKYGIKKGSVSAYCMENYVSYPLVADFASWSTDNIEMVMVMCKFPSELENLSRISDVRLEITLSEPAGSNFISGQKEDFPFDEYTLNLYTVFLTPVGELPTAGAVITIENGLQLQNNPQFKNIEPPNEIKSSFPFSKADIEPVVYYASFKFGTKAITKISLFVFFWLFYAITIIGVLLSLLLEAKRVNLSLDILLASTVLLLTQHLQVVQTLPSEISGSVTEVIPYSCSLMLLISFALVSTAIIGSRYIKNNRSFWEQLNPGLKKFWVVFVVVVSLAPIFFLLLFLPSPLHLLINILLLFLPPWIVIGLFIFYSRGIGTIVKSNGNSPAKSVKPLETKKKPRKT